MATGDPKIYEDIEATADYYSPQTYAGGEGGVGALLSFYHDLEMHPDNLGDSFFPLTTARTRNPQASKVFAIGVLPPAANVTGKILDRSATYQRGQTPTPGAEPNATPEQVQTTEKQASSVGTGGDCPAALAEQQIQNQPKGYGTAEKIAAALAFLAGPQDYNADDTLNARAQVQYSTYTNCMMTVKALWRQCGITDPRFLGAFTGPGKPPWQQAYANPWIALAKENGAWVEGNDPGFPKRGDSAIGIRVLSSVEKAVMSYATGAAEAQHAFTITDVNGNVTKTADGGYLKAGVYASQENWERGEDGWWYVFEPMGGARRKVLGWVSFDKIPKDGSAVPVDAGSGDWKKDGSDDAQQAQKEKAKTDASDVTTPTLGEKLLAAQRLQIAEAQAAIEAMKNTPPLRLLVNPKQFAVKGAKIVQDGNWGRNGPITEHWGNDQDKISASGRVAGFFALDVNNAAGPGLTRAARQFSASWANLMSLYLFYKNNGGLYLRDHMSVAPDMKNLSMVGSIYIYYDNILYIGSFDSFNLTEAEETPFTADYSFEFTVRAAFLLDRPDSRYDITYSSSNKAGSLVSATETPGSGGSQAAADQRQQSLDDYLSGLRDNPSDGPSEDEPGGIGAIQAIEQG